MKTTYNAVDNTYGFVELNEVECFTLTGVFLYGSEIGAIKHEEGYNPRFDIDEDNCSMCYIGFSKTQFDGMMNTLLYYNEKKAKK